MINIWIVQTDVPLTKLSGTMVQGPSNSDHMGIWLATGQVLHWNFLIDLNSGRQQQALRGLVEYVFGFLPNPLGFQQSS